MLKHFRNDWGINFTTVEPFNEPVSNWWNYGGTQEGDHFDNASQAAFIPILYKALKSQGLTTGIAAPDDNSIDETLNSWDSYSDNVKNDISQINTHSYNGSERVELNNASKKEGKHLWMSEYGDGDATGMTMSTQIIADIKQMQPTAWVYWQAVDGPGWGMLQMNVNHPGDWTFVKTEKYYVMENYSKFIRPGYQFVDINLPNAVAAYNASNRRLVIVTTNASSNNESFTYELDKFNKTPTDVEVYRTSEEEHLRELKPITVRDKEFEAIAKANSVTTYVITNIRN
ncbi:glycoside hydrolase [Alicyclobacillus fastidiosus]|uniref:glycoside hydrolase n=1 Tax=Alicyclobacillus fastidiosus TaxID=392011 RepID=UPI003D66E145